MQATYFTASFIGNEPVSGDGDLFQALAPAQAQVLEDEFTNVSNEQANRAVEKAAAAFSAYSNLHPHRRADFLDAIAVEIDAIGQELIDRAVLESGLPTGRITGERGRTTGQLRMFANLLREGSWVDARINTALPDRTPVPRVDLRRMLVPLGPVVVFGASNFPLAFSVAGGDTASALAAGCPVVVKAHPSHPGTSSLVGQAIVAAAEKTGMPDGVFSLVHADNDVAQALVAHPAVKAVGFTGSRAGGLAIQRVANERPEPIPVYAEMSSVNPVVILPGALAQQAETVAAGLAASVTLGVGQFCTNPGLTFLLDSTEPDEQTGTSAPSRQTEQFLSTVAEKIKASSPATMLNAGIHKAFQKGIQQIRVIPGVHLLAESESEPSDDRTEGRPAVLTTTAQLFLLSPDMSHEVFGPSSLIVVCHTEAELAECLNMLEGQLTATLYASEAELNQSAYNWIELLQRNVGRILFGGFPTGVEVSEAMTHGGPFPATTDGGRSTSVGTGAILRFVRPVTYQSFPNTLLPLALQNENPLAIWRNIDGELTRKSL
ncbi:aldehyde dehydrogenase (NADP(+)) [Spirosoma utsteinense]|uniref:NADP-dependent aldehyde dehydrogenase n=1 Tax=Spirosoma utsteinense TaxID=2585773 RepID=A0ABR6VZE8_9BACT|nr:aldehyde dehydrogenase (NADP(+)) [Spirosoma utsteinense]MBC3784623.1 NADP-dependent aldehyde dehydrogenase [Spirosoma utsteinense]MBC3789624.1 NADP-dependent aldehyde dehydrogenase [Spirosoma utsteinense]